jgi:hypothetical protein
MLRNLTNPRIVRWALPATVVLIVTLALGKNQFWLPASAFIGLMLLLIADEVFFRRNRFK